MTIRDRKQLKMTAARRLQAASYLPRRLILIHSGVMLCIALLMTVCEYIITWQIDANGGGLSGIQLRSILETAANVLTAIYAIITPFWSMGLVYASLRLARGKAAWPGSLLEGFRRRRPVIRFLLLQILLYGVLSFAAIYAAWLLYTAVMPAGRAFTEALVTLFASGITDYTQLMEQIPTEVIQRVSSGYLPFFAVTLLVLILPAHYRLRLANYLLMEDDGLSPWKAIRTSGKIMRRNCWRMLLLDLSYWWYYLIPVVLMVPAYADVILEHLQLTVPVDGAVLYIGGNLIYTALTLAFECAAKPKVITTYALAYDALVEEYKAKEA